jgi:hypothetical protein
MLRLIADNEFPADDLPPLVDDWDLRDLVGDAFILGLRCAAGLDTRVTRLALQMSIARLNSRLSSRERDE